MKYNIAGYWSKSAEFMAKNPIVILPFIIIAFLESIALELIYFSIRPPLSKLADPVVRKFFGEMFVHYPGNLMILSKLFYYAQVAIYVSIGVMLTAITINIFKNISEGLPVRFNAMLKNSIKRYFGYFGYGCLVMIALFSLNKAETFVFLKAMGRLNNILPQSAATLIYSGFTIFLFITTIIMYAFLISTVPLMVMAKRSLFKSLLSSISIGARNFFKVFALILPPFVLYLPFTILKNLPAAIADKAFPEINLLVVASSIIATVFIDCFMILCVSQWLFDREEKLGVGSSELGAGK